MKTHFTVTRKHMKNKSKIKSKNESKNKIKVDMVKITQMWN